MENNTIDFITFARQVYPFLTLTPFHERYYRVLEGFARGKIRKLIITMPPQHGKSVGASVLLPAYMLGLNPDLRVAIASYSASLASKFNRRAQRVLESEQYETLFPLTTIKKGASRQSNYVRTADHVEIIGTTGELLSVGREGALTGNQVDIFILDDLYKDAMEANSPIVRENCWEWYTSVVKTRMHNNSSELIVFTRWHEEDLIGLIESKEPVDELVCEKQIETASADRWLRLNFEAIKESPPTELDPRAEGKPLWPERHSIELLRSKRQLDPLRFEAMYQGQPSTKEGLLYGDNFATYSRLPCESLKKGNYTDTADMGDDYLCSVCYDVGRDGRVYVTDVVYSRERMEVTEELVAQMLTRNLTRTATVESNNGGRGFARAVGARVPLARVEWFHQSGNKEARIISNSATVLRSIVMPEGWAQLWPDLFRHLTTYRRTFRTNRWHDGADVLTGIVEREVVDNTSRKIKAVGFSTR